MSARPVGVRTRRPRLLPGVLVASGLVVAAACGTVAATAGPSRQSGQSCAAGQEWVTVSPLVVGVSQWSPARPAAHAAQPPTLAGCVDTRQLHEPAKTKTDARG